MADKTPHYWTAKGILTIPPPITKLIRANAASKTVRAFNGNKPLVSVSSG
jgi:hypothetical protein